MSIIIFIVILLVLVLAHEFGHFFTAKRFGIRVDEFGFGFPPKVFSFKKGETLYSFNLLPIGGFVKIFGETPDEENMNGPDAGRSFINKPKYQQAIVLFAGIFANFLLAWVLFSFGFMSGLPTSIDSQVKGYPLENVSLVVVSVEAQSPAFKAGLKSGDKIISVNTSTDSIGEINPTTLKSFVVSHGSKEIDIGYTRGRNPEVNIAKMTPANTAGQPTIGISMDEIGTAKLPILKAFSEGMKLTISVTKGTVIGLYGLIRDAVRGHGSLASVTGPVGLVGIVGDAYQFGFAYLLSFAALISINLAIINIIPFPALDGGRLFFLLIEKIKGSAINPKVANTANMIGFGLLILMMLIVTYHDVVKLF
ncbi:MAG: RIP metalloprotease RseP [Patescibacteria group bacterium]|nr:RIP metalloprotease RseP [Patescibacteria group bacterium]